MLDARSKRLLDLILITWTALWILAGFAIWHEVRGLRSLADTVAVAGRSLDDTANALRGDASPPVAPEALAAIRSQA